MVADNNLRMNYQAVGAMADALQTAGVSLLVMDTALEAAIALLRASAFVGAVGNELMAQYLEGIRPHVQRVSATCLELHDGLQAAIRAMRAGDEAAAARFAAGERPMDQLVDGGVYRLRPYGEGYQSFSAAGHDLSEADTVLITGIGSTEESFEEAVRLLPEEWRDNLWGVYNEAGFEVPLSLAVQFVFPTALPLALLLSGVRIDVGGVFQGFNDRMQAAYGVRVDGGNPAVQSTVDLILANAQGDRELRLVAHSQGTAIVAAALQEVRRNHPEVDLSFVEVVNFGGFGTDFPEGPKYRNYVFLTDFVPAAAMAFHATRLATLTAATQFIPGLGYGSPLYEESVANLMRYTQNLVVLPTPETLYSHPFEHYMSGYQQVSQSIPPARRAAQATYALHSNALAVCRFSP